MEWLRRTLSKSHGKSPNTPTESKQQQDEEEQRIYGITEEFINHMKSFTIDTFKNFPLEEEATYDEEAQSNSTKVRKDLSQWQERHAILILSRVKEISELRYVLCPRHLKENQFWKIYFTLAWSHLADKCTRTRFHEIYLPSLLIRYELRAVQQEKLKRMAMEDEKSSDNSPYEIEMSEANHGNLTEPLPPL